VQTSFDAGREDKRQALELPTWWQPTCRRPHRRPWILKLGETESFTAANHNFFQAPD